MGVPAVARAKARGPQPQKSGCLSRSGDRTAQYNIIALNLYYSILQYMLLALSYCIILYYIIVMVIVIAIVRVT